MEDGRERQKNKNKIPLHRNELERCLVSVVSVFFSTTFRLKPYTDKHFTTRWCQIQGIHLS